MKKLRFVQTLLLLFALVVFARADSTPAEVERYVYQRWNECVASVVRENALWQELQKSLVERSPRVARDARRLDVYDELIREHELRLKALREMRAKEGE
jgi:hypothetical protein